jgi:hypothetical protein
MNLLALSAGLALICLLHHMIEHINLHGHRHEYLRSHIVTSLYSQTTLVLLNNVQDQIVLVLLKAPHFPFIVEWKVTFVIAVMAMFSKDFVYMLYKQ